MIREVMSGFVRNVTFYADYKELPTFFSFGLFYLRIRGRMLFSPWENFDRIIRPSKERFGGPFEVASTLVSHDWKGGSYFAECYASMGFLDSRAFFVNRRFDSKFDTQRAELFGILNCIYENIGTERYAYDSEHDPQHGSIVVGQDRSWPVRVLAELIRRAVEPESLFDISWDYRVALFSIKSYVANHEGIVIYLQGGGRIVLGRGVDFESYRKFRSERRLVELLPDHDSVINVYLTKNEKFRTKVTVVLSGFEKSTVKVIDLFKRDCEAHKKIEFESFDDVPDYSFQRFCFTVNMIGVNRRALRKTKKQSIADGYALLIGALERGGATPP